MGVVVGGRLTAILVLALVQTRTLDWDWDQAEQDTNPTIHFLCMVRNVTPFHQGYLALLPVAKRQSPSNPILLSYILLLINK